jgi:hypothetical protein
MAIIPAPIPHAFGEVHRSRKSTRSDPSLDLADDEVLVNEYPKTA